MGTSADDTDSLLRAVAAVPSVSPPALLASAIVIERPADSLAATQTLARPYLGQVAQYSNDALCVRLTGSDCATRAASCALALRAAFPRARAAIATGSVETAATERAAALMTRGDALLIDDQTSALLDGRFETRAEGSAIALLGVRVPPSVVESSLPTGDDQIERAIADERSLSARRLAMIMFVSIVLAFAGHLIFPALADRAAVRLVYLLWLIPASIRLLAVQSRRRNVGRWMHTIYLLDIPMFFTISILTARTDPGFTWYFAWCIAVGATLQFFIELRPILLTAGLLIATASVLFVHAGQAYLSFFGAILIGFPVAVGIYSQARTRALLRRVAGESAERIRQVESANREVRALNDELRRQIADRAGQLAAAIARLSVQPPRLLGPSSIVEERYRVIDRIGAGGMGAVYRVERLTDGRRLALKVLSGVADRTALARFAREAQLAAEIDHPNVVSVVDVDVSGSGTLFLVMELVAGGSLAGQRDRYGDIGWALPLLQQVGAALAAMHARGIVHRDLKPSNILLDGAAAKVADFGLAGLTDRAVSVDAPTVAKDASLADSPDLTGTGAIMGTPLYMAPELVDGTRAGGPAADVFSLGVVAYQLLTKELPYAAPPVVERLAGRNPPPPRPIKKAQPELPGELSSLIDRCLAEDPEQRPSADAIAKAIARTLS